MFASPLGLIFNWHDYRHVPFHEWLERNIIDAYENVIVQVLALRYEIWYARNKKCFETIDVDTLFKRLKDLLLVL